MPGRRIHELLSVAGNARTRLQPGRLHSAAAPFVVMPSNPVRRGRGGSRGPRGAHAVILGARLTRAREDSPAPTCRSCRRHGSQFRRRSLAVMIILHRVLRPPLNESCDANSQRWLPVTGATLMPRMVVLLSSVATSPAGRSWAAPHWKGSLAGLRPVYGSHRPATYSANGAALKSSAGISRTSRVASSTGAYSQASTSSAPNSTRLRLPC